MTHMESARYVDRKVARLLAARGWFGVTVPKAYGGMQAGHVAKSILIHRLARVSAAAAAILQASLIPVAALLHFGTERQRAELLPGVADGSVLLSIAVTEPDQGGHIGGMTTTAEWDGKAWILTGTKAHIGNSQIADIHVVVARTAPPGTRTSQALTAFLVAGERRGVCANRYVGAFGLRGFGFGGLGFDRVRLPRRTFSARSEGAWPSPSPAASSTDGPTSRPSPSACTKRPSTSPPGTPPAGPATRERSATSASYATVSAR